MKKFLAIALSVLMVCCSLVFTSCGGNITASEETKYPSSPTVVDCSSIRLSKTSLNLIVGDEETIEATVSPSNTTNKKVTWTSSNSAVADYANGKVLALGEGNCIIKATCGSITENCRVTVSKKKITVTSASFEQIEYRVNLNEEKTLSLTISPSNVEDYSTEISVGNKQVISAKLNANPKKIDIKGLKVGESTITVKFAGGQTCSTKIKVVDMSKLINLTITPTLPSVVSYKTDWGHVYDSVRLTDIETKIVSYEGESNTTGFIVYLKVNFVKSYDEDGSTGSGAVKFSIRLYKENNTFIEQKDITIYGNYVVGSVGMAEYYFGVSTDWQTVREFKVAFVDYVI